MLKTEIKRGTRSNFMLVVKFEEEDNFDSQNLTWVPRLEEIDRIQKLLEAVLNINKQTDGR